MARKSGSNGEQTARDIRAAATTLFAAHGYAAVSMRQIAQRVGVQVGALYLYTPDKQSLLSDLMIDHLEDLLSEWDRARSGVTEPVARLSEFVRFHVRHHLTRADAVFIAYMELRSLSPENFSKIERLRRLYETQLEDILHEGAARGTFHLLDARISTLGLIALLTGVTTWYRDGGRLSPERIEQVYVAMALRAVGARQVDVPA
ncbi:MAG: TetR/AcrR family transcriptional regulator [Pseudomonadota bacterium]